MDKGNRKKIGLLGGNFNPIHHAHLMMADQVAQQMNLEKVLLMPENIPPHVDEKETISAKHRVKMLELAIKDNPRLGLELIEIERGGKSYSYDTLKLLTKANPDTDYYFIIGGDMVEYLPKWYKIDELIELVKFIAIRRTEKNIENPYPVQWLEAPLLPISSTMIREMFVQNIKPTYLLPKDVISYIETEKLYKKNDQ
ncbi:nicotinate-nucleotide adenylyltransferase [Lactococcus cremoris]|uniref:nicotinate-nucleotide adenylyltransferase n=1 Tax=Lactococcus lactis subsp. cremoris TaxID=1359 RepID=UPI0007AE9F48|nr:nicotinate-nucleotide adenylyltransferase [Lactococcus cremoris]KZK33624.1 Nicotinate-nucleotide adenylyltransferase [Lactococcus cremoris]MCT0502455.1 nicotinate-nucleotide adenylyltransferase [Lactococcus cremoris]MCT0506764.1 nicotinate-nucleotide adenylyltransferase [Lactococcus cremoris]